MPALVAGIHVFLDGATTQDVDGRDEPGHDGVQSHSAASLTSGAAARTSASTCASNLAKFFWNMPTSARAVLSNSALSAQVLIGSRICGSTPGSEVGTAKPKYLSVRKSALRSEPFSAADNNARVTLIGMRRPVPYLPPVQPVLTSQQSTPCLAIRSRSRLPYTEGSRGRNGEPKQVENSGCGSLPSPRSVPATFAV